MFCKWISSTILNCWYCSVEVMVIWIWEHWETAISKNLKSKMQNLKCKSGYIGFEVAQLLHFRFYILNFKFHSGIRLVFISLVFSFLLVACSDTNNLTGVTVLWEKELATGLAIPRSMLDNAPTDSIEKWVSVKLASGHHNQSILGKYSVDDNKVLFHPVIPFTRGKEYHIFFKEKLLSSVRLPPDQRSKTSNVVKVYGINDTVPENLLKVYIFFSKPMQQGGSLEHITMIKDGRDTLRDVFLDLQPELWNTEGTMLTLWLDPGRIKRDLKPNQKLGTPLRTGSHYELIIKPDWQNTEGGLLERPYRKSFNVGLRDDQSPVYTDWKIVAPAAESSEPLHIYFHEPLDAILASQAIRVLDSKGVAIPGTEVTNEKGTALVFRRNRGKWTAGEYVLEV